MLLLDRQLSFLSLLRFCSHSWVNRVKDAQKDTVIANADLNGRSDVPGVRSTSPAGRSSPFPRLRPPPTGFPAASDDSPFAPPHRECREDPSVKEVNEIQSRKY